LNEHVVDFWTYSKDVPKILTTTGLDLFFPGLVEYYGENVPIDIEYRLNSINNFTIIEND
jgi:hypothetical protein